jgi:hypothetical protein
MRQENRRSSTNSSIKGIEAVLDKFTSKAFLTKHSLFNNLLSSEELKLDLSSNELLKNVFGKS